MTTQSMTRIVAMLVSLACSRPQAQYARSRDVFASTVRVVAVYADGQVVSGTGVIVGPRHVLAARHVVHRDGVEYLAIGVVRQADVGVEVVVDAESEGLDVARLMVVGVGAPFRDVSSPGPVAAAGEELCMVTNEWLMKCGRVSPDPLPQATVVAIRAVPGNSGAPLYDARGRLSAIAVERRPGDDVDDVTIAVASDALRPLWPAPEPADLFPEMR